MQTEKIPLAAGWFGGRVSLSRSMRPGDSEGRAASG
jgi:hypothetical protein